MRSATAVRGTLFVHPCTAYSRRPWREKPSESNTQPQHLPARAMHFTVSKSAKAWSACKLKQCNREKMIQESVGEAGVPDWGLG